MNSKVSHQKVGKTQFNIYEKYHARRSWTKELIKTCKRQKSNS